uniref:Rev n=1 Tax=Equine infectious anemia virus TaxID=11665 RepID=E2E2I4_9RETR|nr:Rev [Equine infectious anemia virus]
MAEARDTRYQEEMNRKEDKEDKRRNNWWKIDPQRPLDNDEWCRILRQSLPEEKVPSQTCIARRHLGPGPVSCIPGRRDSWIRGQVQHAEVLQEQLKWRIRGVQQTAKELEKVNKEIWRELQPRVLKPGDSKRRRKHL